MQTRPRCRSAIARSLSTAEATSCCATAARRTRSRTCQRRTCSQAASPIPWCGTRSYSWAPQPSAPEKLSPPRSIRCSSASRCRRRSPTTCCSRTFSRGRLTRRCWKSPWCSSLVLAWRCCCCGAARSARCSAVSPALRCCGSPSCDSSQPTAHSSLFSIRRWQCCSLMRP